MYTPLQQSSFRMIFLQRRINVNESSCRLYNVALTPLQRHDVASTFMQPCLNIVSAGNVVSTPIRLR